MIDLFLFLKSCLIGFCIAAPVGPIGLLCIQRTVQNGVRSGFATGLGAALADTVYGALAAFGFAQVSAFFDEYQLALRFVGGFVLLCLAARSILTAKIPEAVAKTKHFSSVLWPRLLSDVASTFVLTLTNPATIMAFMAVFAALGLGLGDNHYEAAIMVVYGVFTGSLVWWIFLSFFIGIFRHKLDAAAQKFIHILSGILLGGFGLLVVTATITAWLRQ